MATNEDTVMLDGAEDADEGAYNLRRRRPAGIKAAEGRRVTFAQPEKQKPTKEAIRRFLSSPKAVTFKDSTAVPSNDLDPIDETYPEEWLDWLNKENVEIPYQLYQIETPIPDGRQQAARPIKDSNGQPVPGRYGRYLRQVRLPRQIRSNEEMWVLVCLQDMDFRIKPTDICDRMYRPPEKNTLEEEARSKAVMSQRLRDFRATFHKLSIHTKRPEMHTPARSELDAVHMFPAVNIKFNFIGLYLDPGFFTPFMGGPIYPVPNPTGKISQKMRDILRTLENAQGAVHQGAYTHWRELPFYPGDQKNYAPPKKRRRVAYEGETTDEE